MPTTITTTITTTGIEKRNKMPLNNYQPDECRCWPRDAVSCHSCQPHRGWMLLWTLLSALGPRFQISHMCLLACEKGRGPLNLTPIVLVWMTRTWWNQPNLWHRAIVSLVFIAGSMCFISVVWDIGHHGVASRGACYSSGKIKI